LCAIALSLAYPIREYIAQRRQIDQLQAQRRQISMHLKHLRQQQKRLHDPRYIEREARDRLHMCFPNQKCYVIIEPAPKNTRAVTAQADGIPWYARLWKSVQQANQQAKPTQSQSQRQGQSQVHGAIPLGMAANACMDLTSIGSRGDGCPVYTVAFAGAGSGKRAVRGTGADREAVAVTGPGPRVRTA
jgi:cell division protein FtsL